MKVTEPGMLIETRDEHPLKAKLPMDVTESGILMETRRPHPSKAESGMVDHDEGMSTCPFESGLRRHPGWLGGGGAGGKDGGGLGNGDGGGDGGIEGGSQTTTEIESQ